MLTKRRMLTKRKKKISTKTKKSIVKKIFLPSAVLINTFKLDRYPELLVSSVTTVLKLLHVVFNVSIIF